MAEELDFRKIEEKWQKKWKQEGAFRVEVEDYKKKKYYITTPYPYMSGLLHLGHLFTFMIPEAVARFKRMQGYNVLFKFGFHCTGVPIIAAANKVKEKEPKQTEALKLMGIAEKELHKFSKPEHWAEYFPKETLKDLHNLGFSIDERYTFITTSLNPPYNAFIRWQFSKLKEGGYIKKGKHPVVWCPKDNNPVGDHDRSEGEGETPQEMTLLKFKFEDKGIKDLPAYIIAATLRPETVYGQTNLWVDYDLEYVKAKVNNKEVWIASKECFEKLGQQEKKIEIVGKIKGKEMISKYCIAPAIKRYIIILPSKFCDPNKGTGIVTSVPSDAPDDWIGLRDLQKDEELCEKYGVNYFAVREIEPISIIDTPELGDMPAIKVSQELGIKSQLDKEKLEQAKKLVYKKGFYEGVMNKGSGKYAGMPVVKAKDLVKDALISSNEAEIFYELTGKVVCRCLTPAIVKIVSDQWFIEYNDEHWKKKAHKCLDKMTLWPEKVRKQFDYVIDWLNHWACAREYGLGTKLPWDERWVIESLSDSTLQMAYCTIAKYLQHPDDYKIDITRLNDEFFDYVFLGRGDAAKIEKSTGIKKAMIEKMHKEFDYWYPFDFRNSAKDLIQNHLAFCIFNHTAIFPEKHWPKAYELNGRIMVDNEKMSKSKGNFFTIRQLYEKSPVDCVRLASANAGEGLDDANYDMAFLETARLKLSELYNFCTENYGKGRKERLAIDDWFESVINECIIKATEDLEAMMFKSAVTHGFMDMQRHLKWYARRTGKDYSKELIDLFIEAQLKMLAPFTPFLCEEIWESIGKKGFISNSEWPKADKKKIKKEFAIAEGVIESTMSDIATVMKLAKVEKPKKIILFTAPHWKYDFYKELSAALEKTRDFKAVVGELSKHEKLKKHMGDITKMIPRLLKLGTVPESGDAKAEHSMIADSAEFLGKEYGCEVEVIKAEESKEAKANNAMPSKPAILVE